MNFDETSLLQVEALNRVRIDLDVFLKTGDRFLISAEMEKFMSYSTTRGGIRISPFPEHETIDERVYDLIKKHPGFRYKELLLYAKMKAAVVKDALRRLEEKGLIRRQPEGKTFILFPVTLPEGSKANP